MNWSQPSEDKYQYCSWWNSNNYRTVSCSNYWNL